MRKALIASAVAVIAAIGPVNAAHAAKTFSYVQNIGGEFADNVPILTNSQGKPFSGPFSDVFTFVTTKSVLASFTFSSTGGIATNQPTYLKFNTTTINGTTIPVTIANGTITQTRTGSLLDFRLPAGLQTLLISGDTKQAGSYSGSFSLVAVPEASTWAMMIAGFGMVGGVMRRKTLATRKVAIA